VSKATEAEPAPVVIVTSEAELPPSRRIWGTGAWFPPDEREALDWLTLSRLLGWSVRVTRRTHSGLDAGLPAGSRWIIIACDPALLGEDLVRLLASRLDAEPVLVVARADTVRGPFTRLSGAIRRPEQMSGRTVHWAGPGGGRSWSLRNELGATPLELSAGTSVWATLDGAPLIAARRVGRGLLATLGFHPSQARDRDGIVTTLLKHLLIWGASGPVAWLDLAGSLVIRMDDPGGAQNVHLRSWYHPKLGEAQWAAIASDLNERNARMSIAYVPGWVDDGDSARGGLKVGTRTPRRIPGRVHPSPLVSYEDRAGHGPGTLHDYAGEFRGIQALRAAGAGDVELHGYTHMHPDTKLWSQASDRYEVTSWFRELGTTATAAIGAKPPARHPLALGARALRDYFGVRPTTLVCPGDEYTDGVLERALGFGVCLVSNYHLAIRDGERFCWTTYVCAPYLSEPGADWFNAGVPVVSYFHDRDPVLEGTAWIGRWLDGWHAAGARRMMDLRELASAIGRRLHVEATDGDLRLTITTPGASALVRPLPIGIAWPGRPLPSRLSAIVGGRTLSLGVERVSPSFGRVILPHSDHAKDFGTG
jgi:hypothetical protein